MTTTRRLEFTTCNRTNKQSTVKRVIQSTASHYHNLPNTTFLPSQMLYYCNRINVRLVLNFLIIHAFPLECIVIQMVRGVKLSLWPLSHWCLIVTWGRGCSQRLVDIMRYGMLLLIASGCLISEHIAVGVIVLGASVVSGTFTLFQRQEVA